jgi:hypothetical protein
MAWSTITIGLSSTLNATANTSAISITVTLPTADAVDASQFCQNLVKTGGLFTDSKHFFPITAIQYLDIS